VPPVEDYPWKISLQESGNEPLSLYLGAPLDTAGQVAAQRNDESFAYAVNQAEYLKRLPALERLRSRQAFDFFLSAVEEVTVNYRGASVHLVRADTAWHLEGSPAGVDAQAVEEYLHELSELEFEAVLPDTPAPATDREAIGSITVAVTDKPIQQLEVYRTGETYQGTLAHRPLNGNLGPEVLRVLQKSPADFVVSGPFEQKVPDPSD
jgi:hypothetical protein